MGNDDRLNGYMHGSRGGGRPDNASIDELQGYYEGRKEYDEKQAAL